MHYKKQLKRLHQVRKQVSQHRDLLRAMCLEGLIAVTFHTTTRQLSLPNEQGVADEAARNYDSSLSKRRREHKEDAAGVRQQWDDHKEMRDTQRKAA